jgi:hypothetical protein
VYKLRRDAWTSKARKGWCRLTAIGLYSGLVATCQSFIGHYIRSKDVQVKTPEMDKKRKEAGITRQFAYNRQMHYVVEGIHLGRIGHVWTCKTEVNKIK